MREVAPDRWRFPKEPVLFRQCERWAAVILWSGVMLAGAKAVFAVFHLFFTCIEVLRYGAPPGTDILRNMELDVRALDLLEAAGMLVGAVFVSGTLMLLTEIARNLRRQRMILEISHGLKAADPPGVP